MLRTESYEKMKNDRDMDMIMKKYPFHRYKGLLPYMNKFISKQKDHMILNEEKM